MGNFTSQNRGPLPSILTLIVTVLWSSALVMAQTANNQKPKPSGPPKAPPLPSLKISLEKGDPIIGLPSGAILGYPPNCSSDGVTYLQFYNPSKETPAFVAGDLYAITASGKVTRIQREFPQNVRQMVVLSTYAGTHEIATLISALPKRDPYNNQYSNTHTYSIALSKSNGQFSKLLPLHLKFQPLKVAVLGSGKFIVLGQETVNRVPVLGVLDTDGSFLRYIDLDNRPFAASPALRSIYASKLKTAGTSDPTMLAIRNSEFVPYKGNILFFQPGSDLDVDVLSAAGELNTIHIKTHKGYLLQSILPDSANHQWIIRTQPLSTFTQFQKNSIVINPPQRLLQVNPETGEVTQAIDLTGVHPAEVTCAYDGELISPHPVYSATNPKAPTKWTLAAKAY